MNILQPALERYIRSRFRDVLTGARVEPAAARTLRAHKQRAVPGHAAGTYSDITFDAIADACTDAETLNAWRACIDWALSTLPETGAAVVRDAYRRNVGLHQAAQRACVTVRQARMWVQQATARAAVRAGISGLLGRVREIRNQLQETRNETGKPATNRE